MYQFNPYDVLSEPITQENVQKMGELIALRSLRVHCSYSYKKYSWLYSSFVKDLNRDSYKNHVFSDAYDIAQNAICFLCEFIGKNLDDVYTIYKGRTITIKSATYTLVSRYIARIYNHQARSRSLDYPIADHPYEELFEEEQDFTIVNKRIKEMKLTKRQQEVLDGYMAGLPCCEIAQNINMDRSNVCHCRRLLQAKYTTLFL